MAQITHLMQAKAAFDAACMDMEWADPYTRPEESHLHAAACRMRDVLEEAEKRWLEEEETPAMMMIQVEEEEVGSRSIGDWLTSVKDVAYHMRKHARERLLGDDDEPQPQHGCNKLIARMKLPCLAPKIKTTQADITAKLADITAKLADITAKLEALMEEYEGFRYTKGLPLASCCTEQPSCVGQQSIITDVPLGRERDDDKQRIIGIITQQAADSRETEADQPVILSIFGPAGIGKTTLVKSIFNDPELFQDYAKAWVDTPEGHDLKKIYTSIISSSQALLGGAESRPLWNDDYSADAITNQLAELFGSGNRKLLLVLDGLWVKPVRLLGDEDLSRMDGLKSLLCGIGRNLVVIVTAPSKSVAGYITSNVIKPYQLHPLSHDTCWEIMKRTSGFEARNDEEAEAAERIGREIASKCCGLPLAAKALGRTLRSVDNPQHWSAAVGDSQGIWNTGGGGGYSGDPPQLPLGFHTLAVLSRLKQGYHLSHTEWLYFATCAFCFSKGRSISIYDIHWLWTLTMGRLVTPSFLDHWLLHENSASNVSGVLKDAMLVSIDDMMYDLARYVLGDRLIVVDGRNGGATVPPDVKRSGDAYFAVIRNWDANQRLDLSSILPAGILALRFEDCPAKLELSDGAFVFLSAEPLQVLDLSGCSLKKLPESIGQLKQLRYLNAPGIQERVLPVCLTRLDRLLYLNLCGSRLLSDLTEAFGRLDRLSHLNLSGCSRLKALPDSFWMLNMLERVDLSGCSGLKALPDSFDWLGLLKLLNLSGCSGLKALPEFGSFSWLKRLDLSDYSGLKALPDSCERLIELEHLDLSGCSCLGGIIEALQGCSCSLEYLNLSHRCGYSSVEDWFHLTKNLDEVLPQFQSLEFLGLSSCLNPLCYTSTLDKSTEFVDRCIRDLVNLQHLDLSHNKFLVQLPDSMGDLKKLRSLDLSGCFRLKRLPESIGGLKEMCTLNLSGCFRLDRLPERIDELKSLETLDLSGCTQFDPLPENVQQKLAKLRTQGSLTIITDHKVYHPCQAGAHEDQSQERSIVAGDDRAQGSASTPQDASFVDPSSAAEPEIIEATDQDASFVDPSSAAEPEIIEATDPDQ